MAMRRHRSRSPEAPRSSRSRSRSPQPRRNPRGSRSPAASPPPLLRPADFGDSRVRQPFLGSAPFALLQGRLPRGLRGWLSADASVQGLLRQGLENPEAYHRGHKAATFHAVGGREGEAVELTGVEHDGAHPPAGKRLLAFARAFREANREALSLLELRLREGGHLPAGVLPDLSERFFGSITVQHLLPPGRDAEPRPAGLVLDWHRDSGASAVHMAVSLSGERVLRVRRHRQPPSPLDADAAIIVDKLELRGGDVYLSSPTAFEHAVHRTSRLGEAVATQFRIAVPKEAMAALERPAVQQPDSGGLAACVAECLLASRLTLPSLEEVKAHLASL